MKKILVVDDEEDVRRVVGQRLRTEGYQVIEAKDGQEAVEKAKKQMPNLILLDIAMPDMDGGKVAGILKEDLATKNIPVIFLTCLYTKREERREGHEIGQNIFVAKPYNTTELLEIIHQTIK